MFGIIRVTRKDFTVMTFNLGSASTWNFLILPSILCTLHSEENKFKVLKGKICNWKLFFLHQKMSILLNSALPFVSYNAEIWSWKPLHYECVAVILLKMYRYPISCTFLPPYKPPNLFAVTRSFLNPLRGGAGKSSYLCRMTQLTSG